MSSPDSRCVPRGRPEGGEDRPAGPGLPDLLHRLGRALRPGDAGRRGRAGMGGGPDRLDALALGLADGLDGRRALLGHPRGRGVLRLGPQGPGRLLGRPGRMVDDRLHGRRPGDLSRPLRQLPDLLRPGIGARRGRGVDLGRLRGALARDPGPDRRGPRLEPQGCGCRRQERDVDDRRGAGRLRHLERPRALAGGGGGRGGRGGEARARAGGMGGSLAVGLAAVLWNYCGWDKSRRMRARSGTPAGTTLEPS